MLAPHAAGAAQQAQHSRHSAALHPPGVAVLLQEGKALQHRAVAVWHPLGGRLVDCGGGDAQQHQRLVLRHPAGRGSVGAGIKMAVGR